MPTVTESVKKHLAMVHIDAQDIPLVKDVTKLVQGSPNLFSKKLKDL